MTFSLLKDIPAEYTWPVELSIPISGGDIKKIKFDAEFKRPSADEVRALLGQDELEEGMARVVTSDRDLLNEYLLSLKAKDDDGEYRDLPQDIYVELRAITGADATIARAFYSSLTGVKAKNSQKPPGTGRR